MKKIFTKKVIRDFLIAGSISSLAMTGLDLLAGEEFNPWKFIFYFLCFGVFFTIGINFIAKRSSRKMK
ncbi:MAG: hypothetical protein EX254_10765 [Flavobacteriaceae bacterium]|nr:MAG: hypothetical protein EX254_10765 [Flavobacteriaceae bacterium]